MPAKTDAPKVVVAAAIRPEQRDELERRAAQEDRTLSYLIRQAVDQYLQEPEASDEP